MKSAIKLFIQDLLSSSESEKETVFSFTENLVKLLGDELIKSQKYFFCWQGKVYSIDPKTNCITHVNNVSHGD